MIEMGKKYRCSEKSYVDPVIYECDRAYAYGRIGISPMAWNISDGTVAECPLVMKGRPGFDLIEVKPEVTTRFLVHRPRTNGCAYVSTSETVTGMIPIGAIDITHDGEKLLNVEIVK